ncbi:MAG: hypothetical protein GY856_24985 [bacterium]|nr:hypothetical protein [bacterium]
MEPSLAELRRGMPVPGDLLRGSAYAEATNPPPARETGSSGGVAASSIPRGGRSFYLRRPSRRHIAIILVSVCCFGLSNGEPVTEPGPGPGSVAVDPTASGLGAFESLYSTSMGVDRMGNLWSWNARTGVLHLISPTGQTLCNAELDQGIQEVDFDADWGAVALSPDQRLLFVYRLGDPPERTSTPLDRIMGDLCWVGPNTVALSPGKSRHRIELWDTAKGSRISSFGEEEPLEARPGTTRLRHIIPRFDFKRKLLWTLEAYTGNIRVYSLAGEALQELTIRHPDRERLDTWLEESNADSLAQHETREVFLSLWPSLALDSRGDAWLTESCNDADQLIAVRISIGSRVEQRITFEVGKCCSRYSTIWGRWLLTYRSPLAPTGACNHARRY